MSRKTIERLERIDQLVRLKATGTPKELAAKLDISESTLYEIFQMMKEKNCPLIYDKIKQTYIYEKEGRLEMKFKERKIISNNFSLRYNRSESFYISGK